MATPDLTLKQDDTWPPLNATLSDAGGPIDLSDASVKLLLRGSTVTITGICTITEAFTGRVRYTWATGDTAVAGDYQGEFEITWPGNKIETVPSDGYFLVRIVEDLN